MKRIRIKRRASESSPTRVPQCFHRIGCDVLRGQAIAHYMRLRERGDHTQADNLTREYLRNKDFHVESWREREDQKIGEIPTTGAYTLNKSLPTALSFVTRDTEPSRNVSEFSVPPPEPPPDPPPIKKKKIPPYTNGFSVPEYEDEQGDGDSLKRYIQSNKSEVSQWERRWSQQDSGEE